MCTHILCVLVSVRAAPCKQVGARGGGEGSEAHPFSREMSSCNPKHVLVTVGMATKPGNWPGAPESCDLDIKTTTPGATARIGNTRLNPPDEGVGCYIAGIVFVMLIRGSSAVSPRAGSLQSRLQACSRSTSHKLRVYVIDMTGIKRTWDGYDIWKSTSNHPWITPGSGIGRLEPRIGWPMGYQDRTTIGQG
eukprot:1346480-Amorphochlora_amoeboformis.AAC.1